jgi:photosystem II stability/assembly factor-like uncharacterized protein
MDGSWQEVHITRRCLLETMTKNTWHPLPQMVLPSPVFTLAAGQNGIWAGGTGGIAWYPGSMPEDASLWQTRISTLQISLVTALTYREGLLLAGGIEGIAYSRDEGKHWQQAALEDGVSSITAFALSPHFSEDQTAVAATMENGILRTDDGGLSWTNASFGLENFEVTALAWSSGSTLLAATSDGIYRSTNAGRAWRRVYAGEELGIDTIVHLSAKTLLATMENGSLLHSPDGGTHWFIDDSGLQDIHILSLLFQPMQNVAGNERTAEMLFVGTFERGLLRSSDGGKNWETVYEGVVLSLVARNTLLYAGTDSGISMSDDQGQTWHDLPCPPIHDLRHLFIYKDQPLLAGAYAGIIHYTGSSWDTLPNLPQTLTTLAIAPDDTLFVSSADGLLRLSIEEVEGKEKQKGQDTSFPHKRQVLLEGLDGQVNFMTFRCNGSSWQTWAASEDGTRLLHSNDEGATWQPLQSPFGILPLVALQALPQRLVAATYDPRQYHVCIWSSLDDGKTWERSIEADTQWPLVATCADPPLISINNILLLQDAAGQWNKVTVSSDSGMIRRVVSIQRNEHDAFDLNTPILIALTTMGLHRSDDWGASWQQDHEELPVEMIIDIAASITHLYVLLAGGEVWKRAV